LSNVQGSAAAQRLVGMIRAPRATLSSVIDRPRSLDLALLVIAIAAACSVGFLMTRVGRIAALDQEVRQLESLGTIVTDARYAELRRLQPYRPLISAVMIVVGWPLVWLVLAFVLRAIGNRGSTQATFAQVFAVVVHASAIFALRAVVTTPINYVRESLGGAASLGVLLPGLGESTFVARLLGTLDVFVLWWVVVVAMGLGMLYHTRTLPVARWLFGAYATGAAALALTQTLRGGI
jgi:hypothetical protein